jgi:gamma-glutamylputrescine oxidase
MTTAPFWLEEPADPLPRNAARGRPEVAVVGGGVTGCACALALAERGVRVCLYEAREIAGGASGRNGGFALRGGSMPYDAARAQLGPEAARRLWAWTEATLDRLESLAGDAFRRTGSIRLAADTVERAELRREAEALAADGFAVEWIESLDRPLDGLYDGAIMHPGDGSLQPARWVRRLALRAAEAGSEVLEHEAVDPCHIRAEAVVLAVDGSLARLLPELAEAVRPTRGQVVVTQPIDATPHGRPHYARHGFDYWQQLPDGRLVLGGCRDAELEVEFTDLEETTPAVQQGIASLLERLLGRLPRITHRWAGIWGTTADGLPLVGPVPGREGLWVAGGYSGHGNVLGLACGELVARAILGERPRELVLFDPARVL